MAENRPFLIWSTLHMAWWRPEAAGYCVDIAAAGVFTDAHKIGAPHDRKVYLDDARADIEVEMKAYSRKIAMLQGLRDTLAGPAKAVHV